MKSKTKKILFIIILVIIIAIIGTIIIVNKEEIFSSNISSFENNFEGKEINEILSENTVISEEEEQQLNEIKTDFGITGDSNLYEVQTGYNDIEVAVVKPSIKYKVAFSGMIKNEIPDMNELDTIIQENHPKYAGIWLEPDSREKFLNLLTGQTKSTYKINENGYLMVENNKKQNDIDKILQKVITGEKLYIVDISSVCYIVDDVSGEILDYNFEKLDKYQSYEYFNDGDKYIMFVTENSSNQFSNSEILESLLNFMN